MGVLRIFPEKTKGILFVGMGCLLVVGCAESQKGQSVIQDNPVPTYTISIESKFLKDDLPVQVVFYSAPHIDLRKVPVYDIDIAVVDPKEVVARSNRVGRPWPP